MSQTSSAFRLAVWKPANPARRLMVCSAAQTSFDCEIHEQLYSWEPDEDIVESINKNVLNLKPDELRAVPNMILVAGTRSKAARYGGKYHIRPLCSDEPTAKLILGE